MANPTVGSFTGPQTLRQLAKRRHFNSQLTGFLLPYAVADYAYNVFEPMRDDTVLPGLTVTGADAGTTAFAYSVADNIPTYRAVTNGDATYVQIKGDAVAFNASKAPGMEVVFKVDVVTNFQMEAGFCDPLTDDTLPAVTDIDTPATGNGATDLAVYHIDTGETLTTSAFVTDGGTAAAAKTNISTFAPTAGQYHKIVIQLFRGTNVGGFCIIDDNPQLMAAVATGPNQNVLMRPHLIFGRLSAADKTLDIKYIRTWQDR